MRKATQKSLKKISTTKQILTLGKHARNVIQEQYQQIIKYEKKVLTDQDPENLHRMRVATRRLRTALQVFQETIALPKAASEKRLSALAKVLGKLRDLDVQIADLETNYRLQLDLNEQGLVDEAIAVLEKHRIKAFAGVKSALKRSHYKSLKEAYHTWLETPQYTTISPLLLLPHIPDLLSPLLASLLLHPGWLISAEQISAENSSVLHDLRKACKRARYQAEFFMDFYPKSFQKWANEIKAIQDDLGKLHDTEVLRSLLLSKLSPASQAQLEAVMQQAQAEALSTWEATRQKYLEPAFRLNLYQMLLEPLSTLTSHLSEVTNAEMPNAVALTK
ncbi:MAG: CHAD domain-containing protein [Scytolyngbya sp. HA4215-MV1]|jgi:CHAD domain-containing protein|nr:CHAD domain-containing protein [Scytolyngbya sp. HA4215-MV1]